MIGSQSLCNETDRNINVKKNILMTAVLALALTGCGQENIQTVVSSVETAEENIASIPEILGEEETDSEEILSPKEDTTSTTVEEIDTFLSEPLTFGDVQVQLMDIEYQANYYNEPGAVISFRFTNHGEEFTCAYAALKYTAFQGDVQLKEETYFDQGTDMANMNKDIKNGDSVDCKIVFRPMVSDTINMTISHKDGSTESIDLPFEVTSPIIYEEEYYESEHDGHDHEAAS